MKKLLAVAGLLAVMAGSAAAQGGGGGGGMGRGGTPEQRDSATFARAFNGITLNADLTAKAKAIITAAREELGKIAPDAADRQEKMQSINAKRTADLKALLTSDEDKTKFDANAAAGRGRRGGGH